MINQHGLDSKYIKQGCLPYLLKYQRLVLEKLETKVFILNSDTSYREEMMNNKCQEVILEKISLDQDFKKTCILVVMLINGNIIVLITFKDIKIMLPFLLKLQRDSMFYSLLLKWQVTFVLEMILMSEWTSLLDLNPQLHKQNKFLTQHSLAFQEILLFKQHLIKQPLNNQ